ncbi:glycosyl transferase family 1 [Candidatus Pacearchaeota archaeon CG10_big_fil_rev_8_21_14_0_10_30_48]|nr:MAG: glycosyl transferase family 1 [Candidatus Pacearchaeota archaeon CG10_big_fil_rev_8_21_14_0_10_30_48]
MQKESDENIILFVGSYPPRECGIATFTKDLTDAIDKKFYPYAKTKILAMNNNGLNIYNYPKKVIYQLSDTSLSDYVKIAEKINQNKSIKMVSIQHEFGIFGGEYGEYIIKFLKILKKPKTITFHSILPKPDEKRRQIIKDIATNVDEIIVMTQKGVEILENKYKITTPIRIIQHGIPTTGFESQKRLKKHFGLQDKIILSSFGMISSGKGYEYVIRSLPKVVKKYPNLIYIIIGATHPIIRRREGEKYRNMLGEKIKELHLEDNVKFYNKYTTLKEIVGFLKATDIYISPTLTPEQITSGTLAYALGCGRTCISTPFLHAQDLLKADRGILIDKFKNSKSFEKAILETLADKNKMEEIEQNAYAYTRQMTWPNVTISYGETIKKYIQMPEICFEQLPRINTSHFRRLTDDFGMIQFAKYTTPDLNSGYTLDDNARALIVATRLYKKSRSINSLKLIETYLKYIQYVQDSEGKFHNIVLKDKTINKEYFSEEAHGRAINALGYLSSIQSLPKRLKENARHLLLKSLNITKNFTTPRAIALTITGLYNYNKENYSDETLNIIKEYANKLTSLFEKNKTEDWKWFEDKLTYSNSKIPEALLYAYIATQDKYYLDVSKITLDFLVSVTFKDNIFVPIGQAGWYKKNGKRTYFDQQPLDAASMVQTLTLAFKITKDLNYENHMLSAFQWFLGKNTLNQVVYNEQTGGCHDGLGKYSINLNQGAESTLSYLTARLTVDEIL